MAFGRNFNSELGLYGSTVSIPTLVPNITNAVAAVGGFDFSTILLSNLKRFSLFKKCNLTINR